MARSRCCPQPPFCCHQRCGEQDCSANCFRHRGSRAAIASRSVFPAPRRRKGKENSASSSATTLTSHIEFIERGSHSHGGLRLRPLTLGRLLTQCAILSAVLFVVVVIALKLGAVPVSLYGLGRDLLRVLFRQTSQLSSEYQLIIFDIRLPRILLGIFVGASLSVAGASFQALLRNPLADPYVLGVSSG